MPGVIAALDQEDLQLMDSVFTLFSFAFKFLLEPLRENLPGFYPVYAVLLEHKNRFVRKFAAQAFSYVLRKLDFSNSSTSATVVQILT